MYNDRSMSSNIVIKSRAIPASSRSKNYRNGTVVRTGGGGSSSSSSGIGSADAGLSKDIHVNAPKTGHVNPGEILRKAFTASINKSWFLYFMYVTGYTKLNVPSSKS